MNLPKIILNQKPTYLKLDLGVDFFEVFTGIEANFENCYLFESLGEQNSFSRYSLIGFDPKHIISAKENKLLFDEKAFEVNNPYFTLREIVPQNAISKHYAGGLVGYLGYDALNYFESAVKVKLHPQFEQFKFGVYLDGLIFDKVTGELFYFFYDQNRIDQIKKILKHIRFAQCRQVQDDDSNKVKNKLKVKFLGNSLDQKTHAKHVEKVKEQIKLGNTFQCEVGFKSEFEITGDTLEIYRKLREVNPSPFMYYLKFGPSTSSGQVTKIIGASPELLFRLKDGDMETFPLAGTAKRGKSEKEDQKLARALLNDPKEVAEHNMLIDLHRNDLGRVAKFGTVKVRALLDIKKFSHVQHISSEITGVIKDGEDMFSALASNFPTGTLSGAPKIESIKIINSLEKEPRGPYGGAVGQFGFNGDCTFAIAIRSLFISGSYGFAQTSGGIVHDSIAEKEYQEILNKLAAIKEVLLG